MEWLLISWALTCGWMPLNQSVIERPDAYAFDIKDNCLMQKGDLSATAFGFATVYTSIETFDKPDKIPYFAPFLTDYVFGVKFEKKNITVGFEHSCAHPVLSMPVKDSVLSESFTGHNMTTLYVKIQGSHKF